MSLRVSCKIGGFGGKAMWFKKRPDFFSGIFLDNRLKIISLKGNNPCIAANQYRITRTFSNF